MGPVGRVGVVGVEDQRHRVEVGRERATPVHVVVAVAKLDQRPGELAAELGRGLQGLRGARARERFQLQHVGQRGRSLWIGGGRVDEVTARGGLAGCDRHLFRDRQLFGGGLGPKQPGARTDRDAQQRHREGESQQAPLLAGAVAFEVPQQRVHVGVARVGLALHAAGEHADQPARYPGLGHLQLAALDREHVLGHRVALEGERTEQHPIQGHAERELVAGLGCGAVSEQLGGHVGGRAEQDLLSRDLASQQGRVAVGHRQRGGFVQGHGRRSGQAEVQHHDLVVGADHDVGGLEVAVHQASGVGGRQPSSRVEEHVADPTPVGGVGLGPAVQRKAFGEAHGDEQLVVELAHVVHRDDVGVVELGQGLRFALQTVARQAQRGLPLYDRRAQDLDCDAAIELGVVGLVDVAEAARAQVFDQDVAVDDGPGQQQLVGRLDRDGGRRGRFVADLDGAHLVGRLAEPCALNPGRAAWQRPRTRVGRLRPRAHKPARATSPASAVRVRSCSRS